MGHPFSSPRTAFIFLVLDRRYAWFLSLIALMPLDLSRHSLRQASSPKRLWSKSTTYNFEMQTSVNATRKLLALYLRRMTKVKILIADDHVIFRDGLRKLLDSDGELIVVAGAWFRSHCTAGAPLRNRDNCFSQCSNAGTEQDRNGVLIPSVRAESERLQYGPQKGKPQ